MFLSQKVTSNKKIENEGQIQILQHILQKIPQKIQVSKF